MMSGGDTRNIAKNAVGEKRLMIALKGCTNTELANMQDTAGSKESAAKDHCSPSQLVTADATRYSFPVQRKKTVSVQRSISLRSTFLKDSDYAKRYRVPCTRTKQRANKSWSESVKTNGICETLTLTQLKRQEALFELYTGEEDVVTDLQMIKDVYYLPMYKLKLMSEYEFQKIFGCLEDLLVLHRDLRAKLKRAQSSDGTTDTIASIMMNWFPGLRCYSRYCANQYEAKSLLDDKLKNDVNVKDFLQRCQDSPFSRKLDLWSFLGFELLTISKELRKDLKDSPRSRLVKYPLILRSIIKYTPRDHPDYEKLEQVVRSLESVIEIVDRKTGEAKCQYVLSRVVFLDKRQMCPALLQSRTLLYSGVLKNKHGTKLQAFLFENVFLLTRPVTRNARQSFQVFSQPILVARVLVEDLPDGDVRMGGSFKTVISRLVTAKNVFRVSSIDKETGHSHTVQAANEHEKKQWLNALRCTIRTPEQYKTYL